MIAVGACAHLGGINVIRNRMPLDDVRAYVYGEKKDWFETYPARPAGKAARGVAGSFPRPRFNINSHLLDVKFV